MASTLPALAAMCSGVAPVLVVFALTSAPPLISASMTAALPLVAREMERRVLADAGDGAGVGAAKEQHRVNSASPRCAAQCSARHAVALRGVDVRTLLEQRAHRIVVAAHGRVRHRRARGCRADCADMPTDDAQAPR